MPVAPAQAANGSFHWAKGMGGTQADFGNDIAVDASGSLYITGNFSGTVDFDPGAGTVNLTSSGLSDSFVSKLDSNGDYVWAKHMGGASLSLAIDSIGNVYTTGLFGGTVDFDPGVGTANLTSEGDANIFVSKLDSNGDYVWAKRMGGRDRSGGHDLAVDSIGNVYTTGLIEGIADFDPGVGTSNFTSDGDADIFISKLDNSGNFLWAKRMGGMSRDMGYGLAVDSNGNVYATGRFQGTSDFDPGAGTANLTSEGDADIFVSKLDSTGNYFWAKRVGGVGGDFCHALALDPSGNVYTTGAFSGTVDFDPGAGTSNLTSSGRLDIFVSKLQEAAIFSDVPLDYWALDFIERLYEAGITSGCSTSPRRYCPESTVTRAEMAVYLLRGTAALGIRRLMWERAPASGMCLPATGQPRGSSSLPPRVSPAAAAPEITVLRAP